MSEFDQKFVEYLDNNLDELRGTYADQVGEDYAEGDFLKFAYESYQSHMQYLDEDVNSQRGDR